MSSSRDRLEGLAICTSMVHQRTFDVLSELVDNLYPLKTMKTQYVDAFAVGTDLALGRVGWMVCQ